MHVPGYFCILSLHLWLFLHSVLSHQVQPDDGDTDQNNTFDDKTSNVISSDDIPVADVKEIGNVTQVSIVDEVSTFLCLFLDDLTSYVAVLLCRATHIRKCLRAL